jgi:hypothetical protein
VPLATAQQLQVCSAPSMDARAWCTSIAADLLLLPTTCRCCCCC